MLLFPSDDELLEINKTPHIMSLGQADYIRADRTLCEETWARMRAENVQMMEEFNRIKAQQGLGASPATIT